MTLNRPTRHLPALSCRLKMALQVLLKCPHLCSSVHAIVRACTGPRQRATVCLLPGGVASTSLQCFSFCLAFCLSFSPLCPAPPSSPPPSLPPLPPPALLPANASASSHLYSSKHPGKWSLHSPGNSGRRTQQKKALIWSEHTADWLRRERRTRGESETRRSRSLTVARSSFR